MSQTNMVVTEGRVVKVFPGKSEKAPMLVTIRNVDDYQGKYTARYVDWRVFPNCSGANLVKEGATVKLIGRISKNSYEKDGQRIYTTDVIANTVQDSDNELDMPMTESTPAQKTEPAPAEVSLDADITEEEIPF